MVRRALSIIVSCERGSGVSQWKVRKHQFCNLPITVNPVLFNSAFSLFMDSKVESVKTSLSQLWLYIWQNIVYIHTITSLKWNVPTCVSALSTLMALVEMNKSISVKLWASPSTDWRTWFHKGYSVISWTERELLTPLYPQSIKPWSTFQVIFTRALPR